MIKVLITGATGFLGSYITERLVNTGLFDVVAVKRRASDLWRCNSYKNKINWLNLDDEEWMSAALSFSPDVIIHCAWSGVVASDRLDWGGQLKNLDLLLALLEIARKSKSSKFVGLGSQAEYGRFSGKIEESAVAKPNTAYGAVKLMSCNLVESYCTENNIDWFWLRLFPLFGPKEDLNWLLPSVMKSINDGKEMDLTPGEQRYAYLYVKDFSNLIYKIVVSPPGSLSGVYNISATSAVSLKELVTRIRDVVNPAVRLNFGALPYRHYQTMHMEGDMSKYLNAFGEVEDADFEKKIIETIEYYMIKFAENGD